MVKGGEMKKCSIEGMTVEQIIKKFHCHRATAFRARKRGYLCPGYRDREIKIASEGFSPEEAYRVAKIVFFRHFSFFWEMKDDCLQEAVRRLLELSGHPDSSKFFFKYACAKNAMRDLLKKERNWRKFISEQEAFDRPIDQNLCFAVTTY